MLRLALAAFILMMVGVRTANAQSLDQQERCASQAKRSFQERQASDLAEQKQVGGNRISADYQSHYDTKIGKCLMLVETNDMISGGTSSITAYLIDANERRPYASYVWMSRKDKKYWEVPPVACELSPSLRDKRDCKTREEFDAFVAKYMDE
jgi:hypothetical protein